jgi:hypothetical protein
MSRIGFFIPTMASMALIAVAAGGCNEEYSDRYFGYSDKVTLGAGDAAAANIAAHTVDVWPDHARRTKINQDGKRAAIAVKRYETNTSIKPKGLTNGNGVAPAAPGVAVQN